METAIESAITILASQINRANPAEANAISQSVSNLVQALAMLRNIPPKV